MLTTKALLWLSPTVTLTTFNFILFSVELMHLVSMFVRTAPYDQFAVTKPLSCALKLPGISPGTIYVNNTESN